MARIIANGEVRVVWVTTIANTAAPTAAEITAGTNITPFVSSLETPLDGDAVDSSDLSSAFNKTVAGKFGGNVTGTLYRDDTADTAFALFPRNTTGYVVIRYFGGSDVAIIAADEVDVWPLRVITRSTAALEDNSVITFNVNFAALDEPDIGVAVA